MKIKFTLLFIIFSVLYVKAQLVQQWKRDFGFNAVDLTYPFKAIPDNNGNLYCSVFVFTNISTDACDTLWILKYDPAGNLLWSVSIKESNGTVCTDFKLDTDSNLLVLASNYDPGFTLTRDFNVIKIDTAGTILWNKNFNDSLIYARSNLLSVIPGTNEMIVTNWARFGTLENVVYVRRLDSNGNQLWKYADTLRLEPGPQWIDNNGFFHYTSQERISLQQSYMHYKKLDLNGNAIDSFPFHYQYSTRCSNEKNLFVDTAGNVFINISMQASTLNIYHQLVLELNSAADSIGSFEDVNLIPKFMAFNPVTQNICFGNVEGTNFTQHRSSLLTLNQCSFIDSTQFALNVGLVDMILNSAGEAYTLNFFDKICKLDTAGNLLWQFSTPAFINANDQDRFNYKIVKNNTTGDLYYLFADRLSFSDPHGVFQVIKYSEGNPSSLNEFETALSESVNVYPNPGKGIFTIDLSKVKKPGGEIKVTDALGCKITSLETDKNSMFTTIDLSDHPAGIYFASYISNNKSIVLKIINGY